MVTLYGGATAAPLSTIKPAPAQRTLCVLMLQNGTFASAPAAPLNIKCSKKRKCAGGSPVTAAPTVASQLV